MYPEFTKYEQYLIAFYRSDHDGSIRDVIWAEASAAVVYIGFKLREALWQPAGTKAMASIIAKYDETIAELNRELSKLKG